LENYVTFVKELVDKGGPAAGDFETLDQALRAAAGAIRQSDVPVALAQSIRDALGDAMSAETVQGYGFLKPYRYSGDFYMIDKIYQQHVTARDDLKNWDLYFHAQKAPMVVRNRKTYFIDLVTRRRRRRPDRHLQVLDIASGPCRDVREYLDQTGDRAIHFHCVDSDRRAIAYARDICRPYIDQITFHPKNALRFRSNRRFDLIWSAGLLDYFTDRQFIFLIKNLYRQLGAEAELAVGNFHPDNPSRD
jgi:SAM-dependent methyltransferase